MHTDFAFVCDAAEATSKINALGIGFDTIYANQVPVRHPHFSIVLQLRSSAAEAGQKLKYTSGSFFGRSLIWSSTK